MAKDFEQSGYKNLELLRFYVSKDIRKIDEKMQDSGSDLIGYFIGSLVDILTVHLFDDTLDGIMNQYVSCIGLRILLKIIILFLLIGLFVFSSWITRKIYMWYQKKNDVSGRSPYIMDEKRQEMIDNFDNIACDGLLICQNYMLRYGEAKEDYIKDFYLYEIIHHLYKAVDIFDEVYHNRKLYISSKDNQLLDSYRVNNFIDFSKNIFIFLKSKIPQNSGNPDLNKVMINLEELIKWNKI